MTLKRNKPFYLILLCFVFSACIKEEIAIPKHQAGDTQTSEIGMEQDYRNQLYFDLEKNEVIKSNLKTKWDLAFESNGDHIILNTGKGMAVHKSILTYSALNSANDLDWNWDAHSGSLDSTAIGNWQEDNFTYVIDRGYDWLGEHQGYYKLMILSNDASAYKIAYGDITSETPTNYLLERSSTAQYSYLSFESGQVTIAPGDKEYDLIFTQYTHLFTNPVTPYLVTGVILNRGFTSVARLDEKPFDKIVFADTESLNFSSDLNTIGYNWKYYSLESGTFTTYSEQHYIIKTDDGYFYKLRFVGFYNALGLKGYPNIEFQLL